jgi:FtsH-binding integral membrane protein
MILNGKKFDNSFGSVVQNDAQKLDSALSSCLVNVFLRMFTALLVTAIAAFAVIRFSFLQNLIFSSKYIFWGLLIAEIGLVIAISSFIDKMTIPAANALFFLYAVVNGLTLSVIFFAYNLGDIYSAFGISALMFLAMAGFGALTHRDLSSVGSICIMALFGIILASIVNFFLKSNVMDYVICYIGIVVFIGLTAYDTQRIKKMLALAQEASQEDAIRKIAVIGALTLYLDFINLFLMILRLKRK